MGGAKGMGEATGKLIFSNLPFLRGNICAKSNPSLVFSLRWLQVEAASLRGCGAADWFALVCFGLAGGLVCMHRLGQA